MRSPIAIALFLVVIASTLLITRWAARRTHSRSEFYAAGSSITGTQNGLAIAGDFMSASTILGVAGLAFTGNADAVLYIVSPLLGFTIMLLFIAEPLRNLGRYTVPEVVALRFAGRGVRAFTAAAALVVTIFYLIAQMVGAGALLEILLGVPYAVAVIVVATLMMLYVAFGGMLATTWVQITKAVVLIVGVVLLTFLTFRHVGYDLGSLYSIARAQMDAVLTGNRAGALTSMYSTLSLGLALSLGVCGLPHVLMRFFTVPDARQARRSIVVAMLLIAVVFLIVLFVLSYAAIAFLYGKPEFLDAAGVLRGGANMAVVHLSRLLGGDVLMGIVAAVIFATILAVVAGLTMASAGALAHDLYAQVFRRGAASEAQELRMFRVATLAVTVVAALLGIAFKGTNISFLVSLAFSVAASANLPVLLLSLYWRGLTRRGVLVGGAVGLVTSTGMLIAGPAIWVDVLGHAQPLFGSNYPTLIALPLALLSSWAVSILDARRRDPDAQRAFDELALKSQAGA
ncbi:MAG TPA: cation acetate symporter [Steroidobacteraceae bacterium]|nr:cation acetate symporter [Steroidobacteraceae bacterium]